MKESDAAPSSEKSSFEKSSIPEMSSGRAGRPPGSERAAGSSEVFGFIAVAVQFALLVHLLARFNLETRAFQDVAHIAFAGFLMHHFLPARWRMPFFLILSVGATTYVLGLVQTQWQPGAALSRAGPLFAIGLVLIGICHLPARLGAKVALLVLAGGLLAWLRSNWGAWSDGGLDETWIWPVLGSMFMFRLMVYLYDLQHEKGPVRPVRSLSYFFLLPNVCFPLFPVIDYRTFCQNYFNEPALRIYQRGLGWITRGIIHLLLWRIVYHEFHVDPSRVATGADLIVSIVSNMAMYLRVSGQFHIAIGLLLLFGFNLPETNRRFYFLAAGFTDLWRRANIYWKDFIMKVFYYPVVFRLKTWTPAWGMVAATTVAFFVTWLLHSYQTFWVRNSFPVNSRDAIFWGSICALMILSSLREMRKGRKRSLRPGTASWKDNLRLGWRTTGTLLILSILWSLWSCDSLEQWLGLWEVADGDTLLWGAVALAAIFAATLIFEGSWRAPWGAASGRLAGGTERAVAPGRFPLREALLTCVVPAALLLVISVQRFHIHIGPGPAAVLSSLFETKPSRSDEERMVRGYYEDLQDVKPILEWVGSAQPKHWAMLENTEVFREIADHRMYELAPSSRIVLNGHPLSTNRWGMRDREYELIKAPGTYRIAMLGSSVVMGLNVGDGEPFEAVVEERLNRERASRPHARYEILNFAVNAYTPPTQAVVLDKKVLDFKPDAVVLVVHAEDSYRSVARFAKSVHKGIDPIDEIFRQIAQEAKVDARTPELRAVKRLMPYWPRLMEWTYGRIAERCRQHGIQPVLVYLPGLVGSPSRQKDGDLMMEMARKAGFKVISLAGVYGGASAESLTVAPWDGHANALGHKLIADKLYAALIAETGGLFSSGGAVSSKR
jgi:hypothetical protein